MPNHPGEFASRDEQECRVENWCRRYPRLASSPRDSDGASWRHTYFYPAEQYDKAIIERLAEHCRAGWGEIEVHLHHGVTAPDSRENTLAALTKFRDTLASHGGLSRWLGEGPPRYAFVHGNWALANSAGGRWCGVDDEMQILADTGCYADFTLPAAPHPAQIRKINALYECLPPLTRRAPHRVGRDLRVGRAPATFPLIVQGPLGLDPVDRTLAGMLPTIENAELTARRPPTMARLDRWMRAGITVKGRPDWLFIKLHCHGMDPRDEEAMLGAPIRRFLQQLTDGARAGGEYRVHFVTAREMVNLILAACDAREGDPGRFRDYRLQLSEPPSRGR